MLCLLWLTKHAVGSAQLSAPDVVTGARGGSVTVPCQYELQFRDYTKYWCRGQIYELCEIVVKTPRRSRKGRSTIADDKKAGVFTVTLTSLRESDEDKYWSVIARSGRNIHTSVKLRVSHSGRRGAGSDTSLCFTAPGRQLLRNSLQTCRRRNFCLCLYSNNCLVLF